MDFLYKRKRIKTEEKSSKAKEKKKQEHQEQSQDETVSIKISSPIEFIIKNVISLEIDDYFTERRRDYSRQDKALFSFFKEIISKLALKNIAAEELKAVSIEEETQSFSKELLNELINYILEKVSESAARRFSMDSLVKGRKAILIHKILLILINGVALLDGDEDFKNRSNNYMERIFNINRLFNISYDADNIIYRINSGTLLGIYVNSIIHKFSEQQMINRDETRHINIFSIYSFELLNNSLSGSEPDDILNKLAELHRRYFALSPEDLHDRATKTLIKSICYYAGAVVLIEYSKVKKRDRKKQIDPQELEQLRDMYRNRYASALQANTEIDNDEEVNQRRNRIN